ncbi:MAG: hypothetical protein ACFFD1_01060 [Candidatus Thorarchaeota archaeon]
MTNHMEFLAKVTSALLALEPKDLSRHLWGQPLDLVHLMSYAAFAFERNEEIVSKVADLMQYEHRHPRRIYQGLDLNSLKPEQRLIIVAALGGADAHLDQATFNYLTLIDKGYSLAVDRPEGFYDDSVPVPGTRGAVAAEIPTDQLLLAYAFVKQMIEEAAPNREMVLRGNFEMRRVPLPFLDQHIVYDRLRLVMTPQGVAGAIINSASRGYHPFFWSPEWDTTGLMDSVSFPLTALVACVWRDACIVKHRFVTERSRELHQAPAGRRRSRRARVILPRVIRHVDWSTEEERERIVHRAHTVDPFYRRIKHPLEGKALVAACERAKKHGYADPPPGWTFVKKHQRGHGEGLPEEADRPREIICKGLQVARIALSL